MPPREVMVDYSILFMDIKGTVSRKSWREKAIKGPIRIMLKPVGIPVVGA
jgi:hypothetical protein